MDANDDIRCHQQRCLDSVNASFYACLEEARCRVRRVCLSTTAKQWQEHLHVECNQSYTLVGILGTARAQAAVSSRRQTVMTAAGFRRMNVDGQWNVDSWLCASRSFLGRHRDRRQCSRSFLSLASSSCPSPCGATSALGHEGGHEKARCGS